jgi:hypothetical protein
MSKPRVIEILEVLMGGLYRGQAGVPPAGKKVLTR